MIEAFILAALGLFATSLVLAWRLVGERRPGEAGALAALLARLFLLAETLFTLPLPVRSLFTRSIDGDISPQLAEFIDYIPAALVYCAGFNFVFGVAFRGLRERRPAPARAGESEFAGAEWLVVFGIVGVSIWMLTRLASDAGGIVPLVLMGYGVTEQFVGFGHYAVAFEWLATMAVLSVAAALQSKSRVKLLLAATAWLVVAAGYVVMGRRGALIVLAGATAYVVNVLYRRFTVRQIGVLVIGGFLAMNLIGLLRGDTYQDAAALVETVQSRSESVREQDEGVNLAYTLTTGHFAVPFETLPQVIRTFGDRYLPGLGLYSARALTLLVPAALWPDRPLPLPNWYMATFYGETELNVGRQFFFLSEAYMNLGPLGFLVWGILLAVLWLGIGDAAERAWSDPLRTAGYGLVIGSMLSIVAADVGGFLVAFAKGYALPIVLVGAARAVRVRVWARTPHPA